MKYVLYMCCAVFLFVTQIGLIRLVLPMIQVNSASHLKIFKESKAYSTKLLMGYHTVHISLPWSTSLIEGFGFVVISSNHQGV